MLVIGADTVVAFSGNSILGKPADAAMARVLVLLNVSQGNTHQVYTGRDPSVTAGRHGNAEELL